MLFIVPHLSFKKGENYTYAATMSNPFTFLMPVYIKQNSLIYCMRQGAYELNLIAIQLNDRMRIMDRMGSGNNVKSKRMFGVVGT